MTNPLSKKIRKLLKEHDNDYSLLEKDFHHKTKLPLTFDSLLTTPLINSKNPLTVSIIIPAYNVSTSILSCLASIEQSSFNMKYKNLLQVVVIDDGSIDNTWEIIKKSKLSLNITGVRQSNHGQSQALNTGISVAEGDIIICCDGDMVLSYYTIEHFVLRHQYLPNGLFAGFRSDIDRTNNIVNAEDIRLYGTHRDSYFIGDERLRYSVPGLPSNMCLASDHFKQLGYNKGLWMPDDNTFNDPWLLSDLVIGALFSLSRETFLEIGGFDERLEGWGCNDGLLAAKAIAHKNFIIPVYAASGFHIRHPFRTKNREIEYAKNRKVFFEIVQKEKLASSPNWITSAKGRILESFTRSAIYLDCSFQNKGSIKQNSLFDEIDSLLFLGQYSDAISVITKLKVENSTQKAEQLLRLGKALIAIKNYDVAIDILEEASSVGRFSLNFITELALAYAVNGKFLKAHDILKKNLEYANQFPEFFYWFRRSVQQHIQQGILYFNQTFYNVAIRCFEVALTIDPKNKTAINYREKCLLNLL